MNRKLVRGWAAGVALVAMLNIFGILPDWTTFAAVLTLPLAMSGATLQCLPRLGR